MTPSLVQKAGAFSVGSAASVAATFTNPVTAGNIVIVSGYMNCSLSPSTPTVTDNFGNTYTVVGFQGGIPKDPSENVWLAWATATTGGSSFAVTTTYGIGTGVSNREFIFEVSGVDSLDGVAATIASGNSGTAAATFTTAQTAVEYVYAMGISENGITGTASGWTNQITEGSESAYDKITTGTGAQAFSVDAGGSNQWCVIGAMFYLAGGGSTDATVTAVPADGTGDLVAPSVSGTSSGAVTAVPMEASGDLSMPSDLSSQVQAAIMAASGDLVAPFVSPGADATVTAVPARGTGDLLAPFVGVGDIPVTHPPLNGTPNNGSTSGLPNNGSTSGIVVARVQAGTPNTGAANGRVLIRAQSGMPNTGATNGTIKNGSRSGTVLIPSKSGNVVIADQDGDIE